MSYYGYKDLLTAATDRNATQKDIDALGAWFEEYGAEYWNGEYYDVDGARLYSVIEWDEEDEQGKVIGYEFR